MDEDQAVDVTATATRLAGVPPAYPLGRGRDQPTCTFALAQGRVKPMGSRLV